MENTKLIALLRLLPPTELNEFGRFLQADYINRKETLRVLYRHISNSFKKEKKLPSKVALFKPLFPEELTGRTPSEFKKVKKVNTVIFELKKQLDQFLLWKQIQKESPETDLVQMQMYHERRADDYFFDFTDKVRLSLEPGHLLMPESALRQYQLNLSLYNHPGTNQLVNTLSSPEEVMESLDYFFLMSKLMHGCVILGRVRVLPENFNINLLNEALELAKKEPFCQNWFIQFYATLLRAYLAGVFDTQTFFILKTLFEDHKEHCLPREQTGIHNALVNYCIMASQQFPPDLFPDYQQQLMDLYQLGLDRKYLFRAGTLAYADFINCVNLACKLERFTWADAFIREYGNALKPQIRITTLPLAKAQIRYSAGDPESALQLLNSKVEFSSTLDKMTERKIRLFCYFDLNREDQLEKALEAAQKFIHRNKEIHPEVKSRFSNFLKFLGKLQRDRESIEALTQLETELKTAGKVMEIEWLLKRVQKFQGS